MDRNVYPYYCSGGTCENFHAWVDQAVPTEVRALFDSLGIDMHKTPETYQTGLEDERGYLYESMHHLAGTILEAKAPSGSRLIPGKTDLHEFVPGFEVYVWPSDMALVTEAIANAGPLLELDFYTYIPQLIPEEK